MEQFVDRKGELATLLWEYERTEASFVVVYGRRRVGKTTLISQFIKDKNALYYLASEESEGQNRESFKAVAADFLGDPGLLALHFDEWDGLVKAIVDRQTGERLVLVIDEFQYLGKANKAFPSILQRIWDTYLKERDVMLILCGSLVSMMLEQTLNYNSPLYGRRTAQLHMKQIPFAHYHEFFPRLSQRELVQRYSVTGGVPKYIELFQAPGTLDGLIRRNILTTAGFLFDEPNFLLKREVSEIGSYYSLLRVISDGERRLTKIAARLGVKETSLPKYLKTLIDLDLIEREVPVTEEQPHKSKKGLYRLKDNYFAFWFKFVYPNLSYLETGHQDIVQRRIKGHFADTHVSFVYEALCRERLWELSANGELPFLLDRVGRWWSNTEEIDVVGFNAAEGQLVVGECKYWKNKVGVNILAALERKGDALDWHRNNRVVTYVLFGIGGFTKELEALAATRSDVMLLS